MPRRSINFEIRSDAESLHQVVFERHVEVGRSGISLAASAAAQLVVDAARLVPLGADDMEATSFAHTGAELDVRPASGHVRGNGHRLRLSGLGDNGGFPLVLLGVQHLVRNALPFQFVGETL